MESNTGKELRERLLEVFETANDEEKKAFVSLLIMEMSEDTRRSYLQLMGDKQA